MEFTRATIDEALTALGEELYQKRKIADISIFGGSAIILQFDVAFSTEDIDVIISAEHAEVMAIVQKIARARRWNTSWLNDGVSAYLSKDAAGEVVSYKTFPSEGRIGLRVFVATPEYLLALKLRAMRVNSRDDSDAYRLAIELGLRTVDELVGVVSKHFPNDPVDPRKIILISELSKRLLDAPG